MLTEKELDNAELSGDELVRLHLSSDRLATFIHTLGDDIIHECKYHTLLKLAKAFNLKLESRKEIYLQKIIKQVIRFT